MAGRHVVLVGAGNIGSHASAHLARTPGLTRLTVVDRDVYEAGNVASQDIGRDDAGRPKALVQVHRLRRVDPDLDVRAIDAAVEDVPLARLRADGIVAAVDNNRARQAINEISLRLGTPWIDAAVEPEGLLARVNVWAPGDDAPCLECGWDERDYARLGATNRPCARGGSEAARSSGSPSALGALAAALAVLEMQKLLTRGVGDAGDLQVLVDAAHHRWYRTTSRRNPRCRVGDHGPWTLRDLPLALDAATLPDLFAGASVRLDVRVATVGVVRRPFVRTLACPSCGDRREILRVDGTVERSALRCARCEADRQALGFDLADDLGLEQVREEDRALSLRAVGVRRGDVLRVTDADGRIHHVAITAGPA